VTSGPDVGVLLYDGFSLLDVAGPADLLGRLPGATVTLVGERRGPVRTDTGFVAVHADRATDEVDRFDVLVVPGAAVRGTQDAMANPVLVDWIRRVDQHTTWTVSVCTGSLILGAAGLLRDRATTYWASADYLERTFGVEYVAARYVHTGKIITAGGVSAGIDMALYLAEQIAGETVARGVQLAVEYNPQPSLDSGDPATAGDELKELALRLLSESSRQRATTRTESSSASTGSGSCMPAVRPERR
jgi:transcriptional regulator GlxA family with amidase domain